jgi:hypothetical protein
MRELSGVTTYSAYSKKFKIVLDSLRRGSNISAIPSMIAPV